MGRTQQLLGIALFSRVIIRAREICDRDFVSRAKHVQFYSNFDLRKRPNNRHLSLKRIREVTPWEYRLHLEKLCSRLSRREGEWKWLWQRLKKRVRLKVRVVWLHITGRRKEKKPSFRKLQPLFQLCTYILQYCGWELWKMFIMWFMWWYRLGTGTVFYTS